MLARVLFGLIIGIVAFRTVEHRGPVNPSSPIAGRGLRVLIVEEPKDRRKLPPDQLLILTSKQITGYLDEKCAKEADGHPAYRVAAVSQDMSADLQTWQDAMKNPHTPPPWIMVSNGRRGVSRPLPASIPATLTLLQEYAGKSDSER